MIHYEFPFRIFSDLSTVQVSNFTLVIFSFFRFLSPLSAAPLVSLVGFGLFELGFPGVSLSHFCSVKFFKNCNCYYV